MAAQWIDAGRRLELAGLAGAVEAQVADAHGRRRRTRVPSGAGPPTHAPVAGSHEPRRAALARCRRCTPPDRSRRSSRCRRTRRSACRGRRRRTAVPSGAGPPTHAPVAGSHEPPTRTGPAAPRAHHRLGADAAPVPSQLSLCVQRSPSSQAVPARLTVQADEQQSPSARLPSSQSSPASSGRCRRGRRRRTRPGRSWCRRARGWWRCSRTRRRCRRADTLAAKVEPAVGLGAVGADVDAHGAAGRRSRSEHVDDVVARRPATRLLAPLRKAT